MRLRHSTQSPTPIQESSKRRLQHFVRSRKQSTSLSFFIQKHLSLFVDVVPEDLAERLGLTGLDESDAIAAAFSGTNPIPTMEQLDMDFDNLANVSAEKLTGAKRFGLFTLFCLKLMLVIGTAGGSWYNVRALSDKSAFTAQGQGAAIGSGAVAAIAQTTLTEVFDAFAGWLNMSPAFGGENVPLLVETTMTFVVALTGSTSWFGVLQILQKGEMATEMSI